LTQADTNSVAVRAQLLQQVEEVTGEPAQNVGTLEVWKSWRRRLKRSTTKAPIGIPAC
jgi:hypothetical protein